MLCYAILAYTFTILPVARTTSATSAANATSVTASAASAAHATATLYDSIVLQYII